MTVEFKAWPKIPRGRGAMITITEKIDGTNACVIIEDGAIVGIQSRKRLITAEDDNYNFAKWVGENTDELLKLGDGYHYGEWAGLGIQKNPHCLPDKCFFLFNTFRWGEHNPNTPDCCAVVPKLYEGPMTDSVITETMAELKGLYDGRDARPEGIVVFHHKMKTYEKYTYMSPDGKWC